MQIIEIYRSIQGESSFAGLPCIFVRLTACNLRCTWCDSEYTFTGGRKMSAEEVRQAVTRLAPSGLVEFTGGEPMLQEKELITLMQELLPRDYNRLLAEWILEDKLNVRLGLQIHKFIWEPATKGV